MKKVSMFENYPDVVEVEDLRKMLGGISRKLAYRLLADDEIRSVKVGRPHFPSKNPPWKDFSLHKFPCSAFHKRSHPH